MQQRGSQQTGQGAGRVGGEEAALCCKAGQGANLPDSTNQQANKHTQPSWLLAGCCAPEEAADSRGEQGGSRQQLESCHMRQPGAGMALPLWLAGGWLPTHLVAACLAIWVDCVGKVAGGRAPPVLRERETGCLPTSDNPSHWLAPPSPQKTRSQRRKAGGYRAACCSVSEP